MLNSIFPLLICLSYLRMSQLGFLATMAKIFAFPHLAEGILLEVVAHVGVEVFTMVVDMDHPFRDPIPTSLA
jgi:hypothetical protein